MRVVAVGGGTAGHVLPAVPVMQRLKQAGHEVMFVGTHSGLEADLLLDYQIPVHAIAAGKLRRYWSWQNLGDVFRVLLGFIQSVVYLLKVRADVVFSKGGFVSFPLVAASWCLRIPVVAHESDLTPGLANRLSMRFVRTLCVSFKQTVEALQDSDVCIVHTGAPLRREILDGDAARGRRALDLPEGQSLLLVTGGSMGADVVNHVVREALPQLVRHYAVLHVCGPDKAVSSELEDGWRYIQKEFVGEGWGDLLAAADVVVSRAGANALFELLALRKRNVLIPLSKKASRGDQIENASIAADAGFSAVIAEEELTPERLLAEVNQIAERAAEYDAALARFELPDAVSTIVAEIMRACE